MGALGKLNGNARKAQGTISKVNKQLKKNTTATKTATKAQGGLSRRLGISGLFFGFVGAAAGQAADKITNVFKDSATSAADDLSNVNKAILLAGTGKIDGVLSESAKNKEKNFILYLSTKYPQILNDIAEAYKQVGKALPDTASVRPVTELALKLATIEDIDTEEATKGIAAIKAIYGEDIEYGKIGDLILNVDTQSKANFNQIIKSFGFAAGAAKATNVAVEDLGAIIGLTIDRIGTAQGGAGRAISRLFESLLEPSVLLNEQLQNMGVHIFDVETGNLNDAVETLKQIRKVYLDLKKVNDISAELFLDELELEANSKRALRSFAQASNKQLEEAFIGAKEEGTLDEAFVDQARQGKEQLILLTNKVHLLRVALGSGLFKSSS